MRNRAARVFIWIIAALLVVLIGISRIYLGVHNASNVLAGYVAALVWVVAVLAADHLWRVRAPSPEPEQASSRGTIPFPNAAFCPIAAVIVNSECFPFSYEIFNGNRADVSTMETILRRIERKNGKTRRI